MSHSAPEISIIIPVYNRARLITETLNSIINQSFQEWECIIVDDHSTDKTMEIVREHILGDERFKIFSRPENKSKGANSCRNFGLEKASGNFIHWFDSDDIAHPDYIKTSLQLLEKFKTDFCRFERKVFKGKFDYDFDGDQEIEEVERVDRRHIKKMLTNELSFNTCNVVWRKTSLGDDRFNENIVYADEWEFYQRLLANGLKGISIRNVLFYGRKHEDSTTYEFWNNDPVRRASKVKAIKLVIKNLNEKNLLSSSLVKYFVQFGFFLKEPSIIDYVLDRSNSGVIKKLKYKAGYAVYPIIRPLLKLKGRLKNALKRG